MSPLPPRTQLHPITSKPPPTPPTNMTIEPVTATTLPAYRRLITTLLPIRYQDKYYAETIANPTSSSLALCALWHDPNSTSHSASHVPITALPPKGEVVAGIQCRLEPSPLTKITPTTKPTTSPPQPLHPPLSPRLNPSSKTQYLYISTLCTLSPHRSRGIATALLDQIIYTLLTHPDYKELVVERLYAHVWEANEEALEWYQKRGFEVGERVEGYYRRLKPSGGRVVRRVVGVGDYITVRGTGFRENGVLGLGIGDGVGGQGGEEEGRDGEGDGEVEAG